MCGIAGIIHRDKPGAIGDEMIAMLEALKHRGPDSTGFALYGEPHDDVLTGVSAGMRASDELSAHPGRYRPDISL